MADAFIFIVVVAVQGDECEGLSDCLGVQLGVQLGRTGND